VVRLPDKVLRNQAVQLVGYCEDADLRFLHGADHQCFPWSGVDTVSERCKWTTHACDYASFLVERELCNESPPVIQAARYVRMIVSTIVRLLWYAREG
jgi:hypothetical protein